MIGDKPVTERVFIIGMSEGFYRLSVLVAGKGAGEPYLVIYLSCRWPVIRGDFGDKST